MILNWISSFVTTAAFMVRHAIEGKPPDRKSPDPLDVDCPDHGKSTLIESRRTACCYSLQWIPSGNVKSRICDAEAAEVVFR